MFARWFCRLVGLIVFCLFVAVSCRYEVLRVSLVGVLVWFGCLFVCLFFFVTVSRRYEVLRVLPVGFVVWFVSLSQFTSGVEAGRVVQVIARLGEAVGEIGLAGGQVRGRMACYGI